MPETVVNATPLPGRRYALMGGAVALLTAGGAQAVQSAPGAVLAAAPDAADPDAELVRLCDAYLRALAAYDELDEHPEPEVCPYWQAVQWFEDTLRDREPASVAGVVAMARVAHHLAQLSDGSEEWGDGYTFGWTARVTKGLLRLHGGAAHVA